MREGRTNWRKTKSSFQLVSSASVAVVKEFADDRIVSMCRFLNGKGVQPTKSKDGKSVAMKDKTYMGYEYHETHLHDESTMEKQLLD
ncbi:hypothetical protein AV530_006438 [Patagioenas fasciata monilis]|uniref:Uncharacterized protein n=1 Tax=Patagioenas fasciata monilis TaxID=372326 RepID=A0A1V4KIA2_PATFA|nr:hypothetical protein AV530_006438 [Patagioenas fasciata monilis]